MKNEKGKIILSIDTSDNRKLQLGLMVDNNEYFLSEETLQWTSQRILPLIDHMLSKYNIALTDLTEIGVKAHDGSYTGLRVGASVANALGFLLGIKVNGRKQIVVPTYG